MKRLSTLIYILLLSGPVFSQIPNYDFENWTHYTAGGGYDTPDNWGTTNSYTSLLSSPAVYTCEKGSPGFSGAHYLILTSKATTFLGSRIIIPGVAVTGTINISSPTSYSVSGGFPYTSRPASFNGLWQFMGFGSDHGHVAIYLFKWNSATNKRDTVAFTDYTLGLMVMTTTPFSIPLTYYSGKYPDSATILLSSSGPTPDSNSYLYVDSLTFAGSVPSGVVTIKNNAAPTVIYPNPTTGYANVFYYSITGGNVKMDIVDLSGRTVKETNVIAAIGANTFPVSFSGLLHGMYLLRITDDLGGVEEKKLMVE